MRALAFSRIVVAIVRSSVRKSGSCLFRGKLSSLTFAGHSLHTILYHLRGHGLIIMVQSPLNTLRASMERMNEHVISAVISRIKEMKYMSVCICLMVIIFGIFNALRISDFSHSLVSHHWLLFDAVWSDIDSVNV